MTKANNLGYLECRCQIIENVIFALGSLIAHHLPAIQPQLAQLGAEWTKELNQLNSEYLKDEE